MNYFTDQISGAFYYIASPGFNESQLARIKTVEDELRSKNIHFFSPFTDGGFLKIDEDPIITKISVSALFQENVYNIKYATHMIAIVDPKDKGTYFEIGLFMSKDNGRFDNLLLLGDESLAAEISDVLTECSSGQDRAHKGYFNVVVTSASDYKIFDISKKDPMDYIRMGYYYGQGFKIITYSNEELSSNIMTAASTYCHVVGRSEAEIRLAYEKGELVPNVSYLGSLKVAKKIQ